MTLQLTAWKRKAHVSQVHVREGVQETGTCHISGRRGLEKCTGVRLPAAAAAADLHFPASGHEKSTFESREGQTDGMGKETGLPANMVERSE